MKPNAFIFISIVFIVVPTNAKEDQEEKLIPLRKQFTKDCIEKEKKEPECCERFYGTYGDSTYHRNSLFLDLPECVEAFEYKNSFRQS